MFGWERAWGTEVLRLRRLRAVMLVLSCALQSFARVVLDRQTRALAQLIAQNLFLAHTRALDPPFPPTLLHLQPPPPLANHWWLLYRLGSLG